jgi:DHA1 family bicyclomycin/chloramphenicol resistance-like MFS transporter
MTARSAKARIGHLRRSEFLALVSMMMALTALSIDLMLPAFGEIRSAFGIAPDSSQTAAIVTAFMIGLAAAQIVYGPLADRFGRKPMVFVGFALYAAGAVAAALAPSFSALLAARVVWGMGAAGARVLTLSVVRDTHEGDAMARTMSFVMAVFILVPVAAPSVGAAIVSVAPWRAVFWFCAGYVVLIALWALRLPETLDPSQRLELRLTRLWRAGRLVVTNRTTVGLTAATTLMFGAFVSYLASSELIVEDVFDLKPWFPLIFGGTAALMGAAVLSNASMVGRVGVEVMTQRVADAYAVAVVVLVAVAWAGGDHLPFALFAPALSVVLALHALLLPNLTTLAMAPMGSVAGTASALIGTAQTGGGALMGAAIDRAYDGSVRPLAVGFLIAGTATRLLVLAAQRPGAGIGNPRRPSH